MPIKDISNEEQSNLFLSAGAYREPTKVTEHDRGKGWCPFYLSNTYLIFELVNFGGKLPLPFYTVMNEEMSKKEDLRDYGTVQGQNQELTNPNGMNRPFAWPIKIRASMNNDDQVK